MGWRSAAPGSRRWSAFVLGDRNEADRAEIEALVGSSGRYVIGDVRDDDYLATLVATAMDEFGRLDTVVSGPAIFEGHGYDAGREVWHRALDINLVSAAQLTAAALPHLATGASVVYVGSISGKASQPDRMVYNVTKAGLLMLAKTGAQQLAPRGIRVNVVSPGWTWSRNVEVRYGSREAADAFAAETHPWAEWPIPRRSPTPSCSWRRRTPRSSPAATSPSTAATAPSVPRPSGTPSEPTPVFKNQTLRRMPDVS